MPPVGLRHHSASSTIVRSTAAQERLMCIFAHATIFRSTKRLLQCHGKAVSDFKGYIFPTPLCLVACCAYIKGITLPYSVLHRVKYWAPPSPGSISHSGEFIGSVIMFILKQRSQRFTLYPCLETKPPALNGNVQQHW